MKRAGVAAINIDSDYSGILVNEAGSCGVRTITYGESPDADIRLVRYEDSTETVNAVLFDKELTFQLGVPGQHNAINSLGALGVMHALGMDPWASLPDFKNLKPVIGRGTTHEVRLSGKPITVVDESYNANPTSMRAALQSFASRFADRRRLLVLGDMLELGSSAERFHDELIELVLEARPAGVFVTGPLMQQVWDALPLEMRGRYASDHRALMAGVHDYVEAGDAVLVKASNGMRLGEVVSLGLSRRGG